MKQLCWGWWWPGGFQSQIPWLWLVFQIVVSNFKLLFKISNCCFRPEPGEDDLNPSRRARLLLQGKILQLVLLHFSSSSIFQFFPFFKCTRNIRLLPEGGTFHFQWIAQDLENQTRLISPQRGSSHSFVSPVVHMKIEAPSVGSHSLNYSLVNQICPPTFKGVQHAQAIPVMAWACCTPSGVVVSRNSWQWE